jgi:hypothetical protein
MSILFAFNNSFQWLRHYMQSMWLYPFVHRVRKPGSFLIRLILLIIQCRSQAVRLTYQFQVSQHHENANKYIKAFRNTRLLWLTTFKFNFVTLYQYCNESPTGRITSRVTQKSSHESSHFTIWSSHFTIWSSRVNGFTRVESMATRIVWWTIRWTKMA